MASQKLSENLITICIVPNRGRWPERSVGSVWSKAHDCIDAWKNVVRKVDSEVSVSATVRQLGAICERTLIQLANFKPFEIAEKALSDNISLLEKLDYRDPQQVQMLKTLTRALKDLREGVEATKRLVRERCKVRDRVPV